MRKILKFLTYALVLLPLSGGLCLVFWLGLVPQRFSPFASLDLAAEPGWFVDAQLAALRREPELCRVVLKTPHIEAVPVPDKPFKDRCGWKNSVRVTSASGTKVSVEPLTCEMAAAVALWITYELQPAATEILGSKVTGIEDFGTFDCRKMIGNPLWKDYMSEHASANALDIAGFTLADGRRIGVKKDWKGNGPEARFLREVHRRACGYFRVALSPDFNAAHHDHLHFDRGVMWTCK